MIKIKNKIKKTVRYNPPKTFPGSLQIGSTIFKLPIEECSVEDLIRTFKTNLIRAYNDGYADGAVAMGYYPHDNQKSKFASGRIKRVYVQNGTLKIASCFSECADPQTVSKNIDTELTMQLLADQINVMLEEAEERGRNSVNRVYK